MRGRFARPNSASAPWSIGSKLFIRAWATALLRLATETADGVVLVAFGAGHLSPGLLGELRAAVARVPVIVTCRPERSAMLVETYGFEGSESDVRATGAVCAPFLSAGRRGSRFCAALARALTANSWRSALGNWDVEI